MGNVLIDLDQRFSKFQFTYLNVYAKKEYELAAKMLFQLNCNVPSEARVTDMVPFKRKGFGLRAELEAQDRAMLYCDKWSEILFKSISNYTEDMLNNINE